MGKSSDISQFRGSLKAADHRSNVVLFSVLGVALVAAFLYKGIGYKHLAIDVGGIVLFGGILVYQVVYLAKAKNRIAREFGLMCSRCGKTPKAFFAEDAFKSGQCPTCGADYSPTRTAKPKV